MSVVSLINLLKLVAHSFKISTDRNSHVSCETSCQYALLTAVLVSLMSSRLAHIPGHFLLCKMQFAMQCTTTYVYSKNLCKKSFYASGIIK